MPRDIWRPPLTAVFEAKGLEIELIPLGPRHRQLLEDAFYRLSDRSRYYRFMAPVTRLSSADLQYLTDMDLFDRFAWGMVVDDEPVGVGRYARTTTSPSAADVGIVVMDEFQGRGLGTILVQALAVVARGAGFSQFDFEILNDNGPMMSLARSLGAHCVPCDGITHAEVALDAIGPPPVDPDILLDAVGAARAARHAESGG